MIAEDRCEQMRSPDEKGKGKGRGKRTCIISVRTLGTSEKKVRAKIPATAPNDAAVAPLLKRPLSNVVTFILSALWARESGMATARKETDLEENIFWNPNVLKQGILAELHCEREKTRRTISMLAVS